MKISDISSQGKAFSQNKMLMAAKNKAGICENLELKADRIDERYSFEDD